MFLSSNYDNYIESLAVQAKMTETWTINLEGNDPRSKLCQAPVKLTACVEYFAYIRISDTSPIICRPLSGSPLICSAYISAEN